MDFIIRLAEEFFKKHKRLARYRRIFAFLAAVVVFATTYELILPAITMDRQRAVRSPGVEVGVAKDQRKGIDFMEDDSLAVDMAGEDSFDAGFPEDGDYYEDNADSAGDGFVDDYSSEETGSADDWIQPEDPATGDTWNNASEIVPGAENTGDDYSGSDDSGTWTDENGIGTDAADNTGVSGDEIADGSSSEADTGVSGTDASGAENGEADPEVPDAADGTGLEEGEDGENGLEDSGSAPDADGQDPETVDGEGLEGTPDASVDSTDSTEKNSGDALSNNTQEASADTSASGDKSDKGSTNSAGTAENSGEAVIEGSTAETAVEFAAGGAAVGATDLTALGATGDQAAAAVTYPATIIYEGKDYTITATFDEKAKLPAEVTLSAVEILPNKVYKDENGNPLYADYEEYYEKTLEALEKESRLENDQAVKSARFFDITFLDKDGNTVEPAASVSIAVKYTDALSAVDTADTMAIHFEDNTGKTGDTEDKDSRDNNENSDKTSSETIAPGITVPEILDTKTEVKKKTIQEISFEAEKFSVYGVIGTEVITVPFTASDGKTYEVTVSYGNDAAIPTDAQLKVEEITASNSKYDEYVEQAADEIGSRVDDLNYIKLLDISIIDTKGNVVALDAPVSVQIRLLDKDQAEDTTKVVHFEGVKETPVLIENNIDGNAVNFETNGFSVYAVVDDGNTGENARMTLEFYNGSNKIATMYVKNRDTRTELDQIIYDPGVGTIVPGLIFKGWTLKDPSGDDFTLDDANAAWDITQVRDWAATKQITENETEKLYAVLVKNYTVTYQNENDATIATDSILLLPSQEQYAYTINQAYIPPDDEHAFEGWFVKDGESNVVSSNPQPTVVTIDGVDKNVYNNNTQIVIKGNVTFSVNSPKGHWLVFNENGKGATYNAPKFVKSGDPTTGPSLTMTRFGYTFGGWYTRLQSGATADDTGYVPVDESSAFTFGGEINDKTTLYAKWTPAETANYTVIIWKQNVNADGYDFAESISLSGNTGTKVNTVVQQGTGDSAYARVNGTNKQYTGFHLKEFDQNVTITPEGDAIVNVYYDRIVYTLRFFYARTYTYNNRTYVQVNCNNEGFLKGIENDRDLNASLTYRGNNDYRLLDGSNTWKDVNNNTVNGNPLNLVSSSYLAKEEVSDGSLKIYNVRTDIINSSGNVANSSNNTPNRDMIYYYLDVAVRYEQDMTDLWPTPNIAFIGQTMTSNNIFSGSGWNDNQTNATTIAPLLQGSWVKGNNLGGTYSELDLSLFRNGETTAYLITYWRFQPHYEYQYNVYFSALEGETASTTYKGNPYVLQSDLSYKVANGQRHTQDQPGHTAPTDDKTGYWDVGSVTFPGTNIAGRVDVRTNTSTGTINVYYDRVITNIVYHDGIYVDGNNNPLSNNKDHLLHTIPVTFGTDLNSYNEGEVKYWRPYDTAEYVFEGWYLDSEGQQPYSFSGTMPQEDIVVYAKWRQRQYRIFLHPNVPATDTSLDWGSSSQQMNFRISYGGKLSVPEGQRDEYEFVGWYFSPDFTPSSLYNDSYEFKNDLEHRQYYVSYDKSDLTDNMDKWGNIIDGSPSPTEGSNGYNSDLWAYDSLTGEFTKRDRFWITEKVDLYGKWRSITRGSKGIGIKYDANGGTNAPTDTSLYTDTSEATAGAASTGPVIPGTSTNKRFAYWVVQRWDPTANNNAGAYVDTNKIVYPGNNFEVLKSLSKVEVEQWRKSAADNAETLDVNPAEVFSGAETITSTHEGYPLISKATYTIQLRAEYVDPGNETPTHITWYANNGTTDSVNSTVTREKDDGTTYETDAIMINEAVPIKPHNTFTYEGHTFLGWARLEEGQDPATYATKNNLFLTYHSASDTFTVKEVVEGVTSDRTVTQVAADEVRPYHDLYAVWDVKKYPVSIKKTVVNGSSEDEEATFKIDYAFDDTTLTDSNVNLKHTDNAQVVHAEVPYGTIITVSETGYTDFDQTYAAQRTTDVDGNAITPSVTVSAETGTSSSFKITGATTVTVTNTRKVQDVVFEKTFEASQINGDTVDLSTAVFTLSNGTKTYTGSISGTGLTRIVTFTDVPFGTYTLTETTAPTGYKKITEHTVDVNANGFTISLNGTEISKNNSGQYMINDPKDTTGSVTLVKVNEDGTTQLSGAKFDISTYVTTSGMYLNPDTHEDIGSKEITGLTLGTKYQLKETKAPDGYIRLGDIFYFQIKLDGTVQVTDESGNVIEDFSGLMISLDNKTISVKNTPGQTLPMTGGPGTFIYTLSGITLLMASALMYIFRMRRRERRVR